MRDEKGDIITDTTQIQRIIKQYYEQICANKLENIKNALIPRHMQPIKLNQEFI